MLAVGNGLFAGFSVYFITSDFDHHFGCTDVLLHLVIGPGDQVTYAGHPLYLSDQAPGLVSGQLTTTVIKGKTVLAARYETGAGMIAFPACKYSRDKYGPGHSGQLGRAPAVPVQQRDPLRRWHVPPRR